MMKISIKREQSQAGLSFAEREKFRPQVKNKLLLLLALLLTAATGARADWTGGTYTATATENLGAITVNGDATLTINSDVTVTVTGGINVASGTLTVTGPGTLVVNGAKGNDGASGWHGSNGGNGGVAISGNIIVQGGATVTATGGTGGKGGNGELDGGKGGNGGVAFAGTLTYKSGTVTANGGSAGSGGYCDDVEGYASSGSAGKAFANDVDFTQTTGYSVTNGTSTIGSVLNQTKVVISGGTDPAATTYSVKMKGGTQDAENWSIASGEKSAKGDAADGLTGLSEGDQVTLQYTGRLKVKGVKATSDAAAAATYTLLSAATTEDIGKVAGQDGYIYDNVEAATAAGTTASAIIAYVGTAGSVDASSSTYKGLAIALTDANSGGTCLWCSEIGNTCVSQTDAIATAITYTNGIASTNTLTIDGHTHAAATAASSYSTACPSGVSAWFLPSVGQWNLIVQGLATKQAGSTVSTNLTTSPNNTYKSSNLNSVITDAGGTGFQSGGYWSSTEHTSGNAWRMIFSLGRAYNNSKTANNYVRAVFAF